MKTQILFAALMMLSFLSFGQNDSIQNTIQNDLNLRKVPFQFTLFTPPIGTNGIYFANTINGTANKSLQVAGFANLNGKAEKTCQGAGFANVSTKGDYYAQLAGFMNIGADINGVQEAGFMNIAGDVKGVQAAGLMNIAHNVEGVMAAGFINICDSLDGIPPGFINIIKNNERYNNVTRLKAGIKQQLFKNICLNVGPTLNFGNPYDWTSSDYTYTGKIIEPGFFAIKPT
jgi:hypothetical protein